MTGTVKTYYLKEDLKMSATQKTTHYEIPIYASGDETGWLSGFNPAMQKIDTTLFNINQTAEDANKTAAGAETNAQQAIASTQATANLLSQTNNTVTGLVNKLTFHSVKFDRPDLGAIIIGESNADNSITVISVNLTSTEGIASSYTVNGSHFYEFGSCSEKLCNNVLSGSVANGFTGTMKQIGYLPCKVGDTNEVNGFKCFYDNIAKKTRFGFAASRIVKVNDFGSSCANITFTNTQAL